jgi:dihydroorotase
MMESVLFSHVTLHDPSSKHHLQVCDLLVMNGLIKKIGNAGTLSMDFAGKTIKGGHLAPGWVDMRVHLTVPGHEYKEDLNSLAAAALAGGFTRILGLPNTTPAIDNAGQVRSLLQQAKDLPIHLHVSGALTQGAKGVEMAEMYDMHLAGAVAFGDGANSVQSGGILLRALQYLQPFDGLLLHSPLDLGLAGNAEVAEGKNSTMVGMKGIPALAEEMGVLRDIRLYAHSPQRMHLGPITTQAGVGILAAAKPNSLKLSAETTALHLLLDDSMLLDFDVNAKVWPPLRSQNDVASLREAILDGTLDVISSGHQPQSLEEKLHDFADASFGAEMLETTFAAALTALGGVNGLEKILAAMGKHPRAILGLPEVRLEEGGLAEFSHFDPEINWVPNNSDLRSKSRNNPLLGRQLIGRPLGAFVKGAYHSASK